MPVTITTQPFVVRPMYRFAVDCSVSVAAIESVPRAATDIRPRPEAIN
jgi:hypothetical protein